MLTSKKVKECAKRAGADIVGVASMDRFEDAPKQMDPRFIFPDAKSAIVMGFRHFRGLFRGIEEGTFFTAYSSMGYAGINYVYQPLVLWKVGRMIEDEGYEALPIPNNFQGTNMSGNPRFSQPVSEGKPAPNVFIHLRIAAFCAGLGEIGYSKLLLSPEFGPRQRLAALLTDALLEPDPLFSEELCDKCMACVNACSVKAMPKDKVVKVTVAGRELEWADIDMKKCSAGFSSASKQTNPFMVTPEDETKVQRYKKLPPMYFYARALEGAAGCIRACMIHLEQQGKLKNVFKKRFRKKKPWRMF